MSGKIYWFICTRQAATLVVPALAGSQAEFNRRTANALAGLFKGRRNVGDLLARPNASAVPDHLLCDGSAISRVGFPQLFKAIGTEWGEGDGTTTFNVPNLLVEVLPVAETAPPQVVDAGGTVSTGDPVVQPTQPGETGGSSGGNVPSGGRTPRNPTNSNPV